MKNKNNKWWNFFKFKFNKSESKHEPNEPNVVPNMENYPQPVTTYRKFVIPVGNTNRKWWEFRKKYNDKKRVNNEVSRLISNYSEEINFGYDEQMWFPSPNIDTNTFINLNNNINNNNTNE